MAESLFERLVFAVGNPYRLLFVLYLLYAQPLIYRHCKPESLVGGGTHYRPLTAWFARSPYGIHGMGHVSRVIIWADMLGVCYQGRVDRDSLLWAASLHDIGRSHDNRCLVHGHKSAEMFMTNRERWNMPQDMDVDYVKYLVTNHCLPVEHPTLELKILKDADALDRARLGDLDSSMLRLPESHCYIQAAEELYHRTRSDRALFWSVLRAAAKTRLWMRNV